MSKIICFYHLADLDGKCSGAIFRYVLGKNVKLIPFNYNHKVDWSLIDKNTIVFMVDLSLSKEDMIRMKETAKQFIWIDHHISKIKEIGDIVFEGIRRDGTAACVLTWEYFFDKNIPTVVEWLGAYDVWDIRPTILAFQYGMRQYDCDPENLDFWSRIFEDNDFVRNIATEGQTILRYVEAQNIIENRNCFLTKFRDYSVLAANKSHCSSLFFETHPEYHNVDILMAFAWNGKSWKISFYTLKDDIDVSKICQEFGGGGHKKAAGMFLEELPTEISNTIFSNNNINFNDVGKGK